jgi:sortase A
MKSKNFISLLLIASGMALLGWWIFTYVQREETVASTREWLQQTTAKPTSATVWLNPDPSINLSDSEPLGMLSIKSVHLEVPVLAGEDDKTLSRAAGWIKGTVLPGSRGNAGIAAHRDTLFRPLRNVKLGDEVVYYSPSGSYTYRIIWTKIVNPSDIYVLDSTSTPSLTLVSCYPFNYIGSAPYRFIVRAEAAGL